MQNAAMEREATATSELDAEIPGVNRLSLLGKVWFPLKILTIIFPLSRKNIDFFFLSDLFLISERR